MEDHVGRVLRPPRAPAAAPLATLAACLSSGAALGALGAAREMLAADAASLEWALLAGLLGTAAVLLLRAGSRAQRGWRAVGLAAALLGGAVALGVLGQAFWLVGRAYLAEAPTAVPSAPRSP